MTQLPGLRSGAGTAACTVNPTLMRVLIQMIHPPGIKGGRPSFNAMNNVSLFEQEFCKVGAILTGCPGYQRHGRFYHLVRPFSPP